MSHYFDDDRPSGPALWGPDDELELWDDDSCERAPALSLDPLQLAALGAAVDAGLRERGCDHTLSAAQRWAASAGVAWSELRAQLEGNGGYCDCEVLLNVLGTDVIESG